MKNKLDMGEGCFGDNYREIYNWVDSLAMKASGSTVPWTAQTFPI